MAIEMEKGSVSIDAQNIMPVIKRWLYSDKDIFLREVVSNGCDAITKYRMTNPDDESEMSVMVTVDKENKTLTISDTGIGMTEDEVKRYINQVAFSGASEFMKKFEGDEKKGDIIGHFGLGFYSVFMVSENVEIETLSCQEGAEPVHWESKDGMDFAISEGHRTTHGTSIILHISDEEKEFLELYRVREVLTRYCGYMAYPIYLMDANAKPVEREEEIPGETNEDGTPKKRKVVDEPKPSLINDTKPLWLKKPSECEDKEYIDFYHKMFGWEDPLFWVHLNVDYPFNLKGILYFPKLRNDFGKYEGQVKLFAGQVFVADNVKEVIPEFLTLLKGVIDCPDLPLNVSRSFLQNDGTVKKLSAHITKKVADKLCGLFNTERETYQKYWDDIAPFVKFGAMRDQKFYEQVKKAILYKTTDGRYLTLEEYKTANADKADKKADRAIDECNKRSAERTDQCHDTNGRISPFLSILKSQTFWKKNAENSDKINNDQTDEQVTDNCSRPIHQPCLGHQEKCQVRKERPCNKCAGDNRHGCTDQINGAHKGSRLSDKTQNPGSTAFAFLFLLGQNGLIDSGNSYFCSGKSCIN